MGAPPAPSSLKLGQQRNTNHTRPHHNSPPWACQHLKNHNRPTPLQMRKQLPNPHMHHPNSVRLPPTAQRLPSPH
ncbi:hypothetical protein CVS40_5960 [Lucilia cuprina]|nr:hypothetical protein CVS40_5960 [Lucilia cuprina]